MKFESYTRNGKSYDQNFYNVFGYNRTVPGDIESNKRLNLIPVSLISGVHYIVPIIGRAYIYCNFYTCDDNIILSWSSFNARAVKVFSLGSLFAHATVVCAREDRSRTWFYDILNFRQKLSSRSGGKQLGRGDPYPGTNDLCKISRHVAALITFANFHLCTLCKSAVRPGRSEGTRCTGESIRRWR